MKLFLASNNAHKAAELAALAARDGLSVEIISARAVGGMPPVVEDAGTFIGNARKKARALQLRLAADAATTGAWALADVSGLCVDALGGAPGVDSANYAGLGAGDAANLTKLVAAMRNVPEAKRGAQFCCVLLLAGPGGEEQVCEGRCAGHLLREPRGTEGFGYDPLFMPEGHTRSFAEMSAAEKNLLSHRARAWSALASWMRCRQ